MKSRKLVTVEMNKHKHCALERWSSMSLSLDKSGNKKYLEYNKNNDLCEL